MSELALTRVMVGALAAALAAFGCFLFAPGAGAAVARLPRARALGWGLSALCWAWVAAQLTLHPIDFLAFLTPARTIVGAAVCLALTWLLLGNLLCARALGGLMMLWPMPVILAVREQATAWRLVPVSVGYASLTFGMVVVFYPWVFRAACDALAGRPGLRRLTAALFLASGAAAACAAFALGEVIGQ